MCFARRTFVVFLMLSLSVGCVPNSLEDSPPTIHDGRVVVEANDDGSVVYQDEVDDTFIFQKDVDGYNFPTGDSGSYFKFKRSFEEVSSYLTPEVESAFDLFIFVNVRFQNWSGPNDFIPPQHMQIFRRTYQGQRLFVRNQHDVIVDVKSDVWGTQADQPVLPGFPILSPVSSGASHREEDPQPYVDTFSGLFRLNHEKSVTHKFQEGMYDSLYVDVAYRSGKASGIAIHGTPEANYWSLGQQRSHGCVRIRRDQSQSLYDFAMSPSLRDQNLPTFDRKKRLGHLLTGPSGEFVKRSGQRVLLMFFDGHYED